MPSSSAISTWVSARSFRMAPNLEPTVNRRFRAPRSKGIGELPGDPLSSAANSGAASSSNIVVACSAGCVGSGRAQRRQRSEAVRNCTSEQCPQRSTSRTASSPLLGISKELFAGRGGGPQSLELSTAIPIVSSPRRNRQRFSWRLGWPLHFQEGSVALRPPVTRGLPFTEVQVQKTGSPT